MTAGSGPTLPPVPEAVRALAAERDEARRNRGYAAADALRERIEAAGFRVTDTPEGPRLEPLADEVGGSQGAGPDGAPSVPSALGDPPTVDVTLHWLVEGWPEDVTRGIASFASAPVGMSVQHVVVDLVTADPA